MDNNTFAAEQDAILAKEVAMAAGMNIEPEPLHVRVPTMRNLTKYRAARKKKAKAAKASRRKSR